MNGPLLQTRSAWNDLRNRLDQCPAVHRYGAEEAPTLTHALSDIETSARRFLLEQLPRLVSAATASADLEGLLFEIREEFRHLLYHIHDPEFFRVVEPTHDWLAISDSQADEGNSER